MAEANQRPGCVFCLARDNPDDAAALIVYRGRSVFAILNKFPYTSGHLMIVPNEHTASFVDLDESATTEMFALAKRAIMALKEEYRPDGHNVGMNLGQAAGAGIADHLHLHIVPRWTGDANFVSVVGETRVLPEDLSVTRSRLSRRMNQ
ncbi:MAG TPA: HIT domain-containing protein [Blastocatellia bacterium]|nr:HIT domain-containing protein [Blastocatellia bacterium]